MLILTIAVWHMSLKQPVSIPSAANGNRSIFSERVWLTYPCSHLTEMTKKFCFLRVHKQFFTKYKTINTFAAFSVGFISLALRNPIPAHINAFHIFRAVFFYVIQSLKNTINWNFQTQLQGTHSELFENGRQLGFSGCSPEQRML